MTADKVGSYWDHSSTQESPVRVKLTLRMKRSPMLDEVLSEGREGDSEPQDGSQQKQQAEYEVLRVEGVEKVEHKNESLEKGTVKKKKNKNKRKIIRPLSPSESPTKMKKLKLVFGSETVSTVNYSG